jgi:hypothetical protein
LSFQTVLLLFTSTCLGAIVVAAVVFEKPRNAVRGPARDDSEIDAYTLRSAPVGWHPEERDHKATERQYWRIQARIGVVALAVTACAFIGLIVNIAIATKALNVAQRSAELQVRAYVQVGGANLENFLEKDMIAKFDVKNLGASPATNIRVVGQAAIVKLPIDWARPMIAFGDVPLSKLTDMFGIIFQDAVLGPQQTDPVRIGEFYPLTDDELNDLAANKSVYIVAGAIYCNDIYEKQRVTKFCYVVHFPFKEIASFCPTGNEAK